MGAVGQQREDCGRGGVGGYAGRKERAAGHGERGCSGKVKGQLLWALEESLRQGGGAPVTRDGKDGGSGLRRNWGCGKAGESYSPGDLSVAGPRICGDCGPRRSGVWGLLLNRPGVMGLEVMANPPTAAPGSKLGESQALLPRLGQPLILACGCLVV